MAPRIDLNLEYEESEVVATEENVMTPELTPATTPDSSSAGDDEGIIPFRTSKRLQGAIYRMIQQRDGSRSHDHNVAPAVTKEKNSGPPSAPPSRKVKRRLESLSPERIEVVKTEDRTSPRADIVKDVGNSRKRKTKSCMVHFADPLFSIINDEKEVASRQLVLMSKGGEEKGRHSEDESPSPSKEKTSPQTDKKQQQRLPPMSCFDLMCNHVGPKGWRCYRTCEEGKSFCRFHDTRKTLWFESGITRAVHI
ncbi:unnamed protein product [Calypogeia fissa]